MFIEEKAYQKTNDEKIFFELLRFALTTLHSHSAPSVLRSGRITGGMRFARCTSLTQIPSLRLGTSHIAKRYTPWCESF